MAPPLVVEESAMTLYDLARDAYEPESTTARNAVRVVSYLLGLGDDELLVLSRLAERLELGRATYGPLNLADRRRDFRGDAIEEVLDFALYRAMHDLRDIRSGQ